MEFIINLLTSWGIKATVAPFLAFSACFFFIILVAYFAHILFKIYLTKNISSYMDRKPTSWGRPISEGKISHRLSHLVPAMIIYAAVPLLNSSSLTVDASVIRFIQAIMLLYILVACVLVFNSLVYIIEHIYSRQKGSRRRPIKSYVQVIRIIVYFLALIVAVSIVINKSPIALFTGLGAMTAILLLVFKDTISGFVASVQLASYDMVRVDDWIVMPKYGADGDVIEISLNSVKIQNFDKTIVTVPTSALLTEGMTNWRGMLEAGGRRIKRPVNIDLKSIRFCNTEILERIYGLELIRKDLSKEEFIEKYKDTPNISVFREYVENYLLAHPNIHKKLTLMVRELQLSEYGLPVEIYAFTNDTNWNRYEGIQAGIFDHLLSIVDEFDLGIYQKR